MITTKIGPELIEQIKLAYAADRPVLLVGRTGVGKSECLQQAARELGISFLCRDLSLMEAPDLAGIPVVKNGRTHYAPPSFLPKTGKGLFVLEELNRAPRYTQAPCLQLLTMRTLNDYTLPQGWLPAAATNPATDGEYIGTEELDAALLARFMIINCVADVKAWLGWAEQNGVHEAVRQFVEATPKIFDSEQSNPRAWTYASDVLHAFERGAFSKQTLLAGMAGLVGDKLSLAFLKSYRRGGPGVPAADQVVKAYGGVRSLVRKWKKNGNVAALEALCRGVLLLLQDPDAEARIERNARGKANLRQCLEDLPAELRKKVLEAHPWLATTPPRRKRA